MAEGLVAASWDGSAWSSYGPFDFGPVEPWAPYTNLGLQAALEPPGTLWFTTGDQVEGAHLYVITPKAVADTK